VEQRRARSSALWFFANFVVAGSARRQAEPRPARRIWLPPPGRHVVNLFQARELTGYQRNCWNAPENEHIICQRLSTIQRPDGESGIIHPT